MGPISKIYDISITLNQKTLIYPGDPVYHLQNLLEIDQDYAFSLSKLDIGCHSGTHLDAPSHFVKNGQTIGQVSLTQCILPAYVADIQDRECIKREELEGVPIKPDSALLFKTLNSKKDWIINSEFQPEFVYLSKEAAQYCVEKQLKLVGIDYLSVEKYKSTRFDSHLTLLSHNVLILESINLKEVPEGWYTLICLPLKLESAEASPVRAVLIK